MSKIEEIDESTTEETQKEEKRKISNEERINFLIKDFDKPLFMRNDMKVAAGIGLYFRITASWQEKSLNTRTLMKDARLLLKEINEESLLNIFKQCNKIQFAIADKERKPVTSSNLRIKLIENYLGDDKWESPSEKLSLAFMIGYDSYSAIYNETKE